MHSAEARDAMTKRVASTFKQCPAFASLPMLAGKEGLIPHALSLPAFVALLPEGTEYPVDERTYVTALHAASALGQVVGRGPGKEKFVLFYEKVA